MGDEPEVWITGPDDQDPAGSSPPPPRGSARGAGWVRWVALGAGFAVLIVVVAVQHYLGGGSTDATPGPTTLSRTPSPAPSSTVTSTSPTTRTSTTVSTTPQPSTPPTAAADNLGTAIGPCGDQQYVARVGYVSRPPDPVEVTVLTGTHPRRVDLATGTASAPLITLPGTQVVLDVAVDSNGTVLIRQSCTDRMTMTVLRVARDAHSADRVSTPSGWRPTGSLITVDGHVWAVVARPGTTGGYSRAELLATDGTGRTMTMPQGLVPTAGWKSYAVGTLGASGSGLAVYDTTRGGTLTQVTDAVDRFIVGVGAVFWTTRCDKSCAIHRFDLASGKDAVVARTTAPGGPARWLAVSPNGNRIVQTSLEPTGPAGGTLQVIDLSTGTVTAVPGLQLGAASPSVAFTPDSQWLIVAVPTLVGGRILLYDSDLNGPYEAGVTVPGPQIGRVPLDIVDSRTASGDSTTSATPPTGESLGRDHVSLSCDDSAGDLPTGDAADNITIGGADLTGLRGNQTPLSAADAGLVVPLGADWYFRKAPVYIKAGAGPVTLTLHGAGGQFLSWVPASVWTGGSRPDLGPWAARSVTLEGCADHGAMYLGGLLATDPGEEFEVATSGGVSDFADQVSLEAGGRILAAHPFVDGCDHARPIASKFPGRSDVVIGPLSYAGLRSYENATVNQTNWNGSYFSKSGAQLPPGATVTVTIDDSAAGYAAIVTEAGPDAGSRSVTYRSCQQQPNSTGSWWVGGIVLFGRNTACVPMTVTDPKNHTTYRAVVSLGAGACPGT